MLVRTVWCCSNAYNSTWMRRGGQKTFAIKAAVAVVRRSWRVSFTLGQLQQTLEARRKQMEDVTWFLVTDPVLRWWNQYRGGAAGKTSVVA